MTINRSLAGFLLLLVCFSFDALAQTPGAGGPAKPTAAEAEMVRPSDFVRDFPDLKWGASVQETKQAIEKTGAKPVGLKNSERELAWDATLDGMRGRGAVFFREGAGLSQIAIGVYAFGKRAELFDAWLKKLTERHGAAQEERDDEFALIKVWRLKNGFALQLRTLKDAHSPVVELTWVKG
jgi:hypothetical protein